MTKEQAIKNLLEIVELSKNEIKNGNTNIAATLDYEDLKSLQIALQMIEENSAEIQQKNTELAEKSAEIEKKDNQIEQYQNILATNDMLHVLEYERKNKQIDLMAEQIKIPEPIIKIESCDIKPKTKFGMRYLNKEEVKQYFEKKVEE